MAGEYVPYRLNAAPDGSVWSRSQVLNLDFHWDGEQFDIRDPLTGRTIHPVEMELYQARLEHDVEIEIERRARNAERQARLDAESELRSLREENDRLRRRQSDN